MNWQIPDLETRSILSSSDAHSGPKLAREATVFVPTGASPVPDYSYKDIAEAIKQSAGSRLKIGYTIEFFPEEGKYHWTGHRVCNVKYSPLQEKEKGTVCPACGKPLTVGVESRVMELSDRLLTEKDILFAKNSAGLTFVDDSAKKRKPFVSIIPLSEVMAELNGGSAVKGERAYTDITEKLGTEFDILLRIPYEKIESYGGSRLKQAIEIIRSREAYVDPGYDGVFGTVKIFKDEKTTQDQPATPLKGENQPALF
jgi:PHP family Zn ribbon phosphoesterase